MTDQPPPPHLSPAELRRLGRAALDWIADYHQRLESFPVLAQVAPGAVRAQLPPSPPADGEPFAAVLRDLEAIVLPGITHWQSPSFFAYFPSNASGPAILGELLSAGLGVQGMLWATSPACTELESHVLDWLVEPLGLPAAFRSDGRGGGVIQDTASSAALCALVAARERTNRRPRSPLSLQNTNFLTPSFSTGMARWPSDTRSGACLRSSFWTGRERSCATSAGIWTPCSKVCEAGDRGTYPTR